MGLTLEMQEILKQINEHIRVLNDDSIKLASSYNSLVVSIAVLTERMDTLYKFFWITFTAVMGTLITNVWQLIKFHKK